MPHSLAAINSQSTLAPGHLLTLHPLFSRVRTAGPGTHLCPSRSVSLLTAETRKPAALPSSASLGGMILERARTLEEDTEVHNCPCHWAGYRAAPTAIRQPYLTQVPSSLGRRRVARARAPSCGQRPGGPGRGSGRERGRGEERAGRRGGADWAPPARGQTGFLRRRSRAPRPSPRPAPFPGPLLG